MIDKRSGKRKLEERKLRLPKPPMIVCNPAKCEEDCPQRNLKQGDGSDEFKEILKNYLLIHHVERTEIPEDGSCIIEAWAHVFCPPDSMYDYDTEINKQLEEFFNEIGVNIEEESWGDEGFSMSGIVNYR
ncbi:MAG: hypothetical protein ABSE72_11715 [Bacteroidales bacterium]|jgi:hypothetical protein